MTIYTVKDEVYQPRFKAYLLHHSLKIGDHLHMHEYILWVSAKCRTFKRLRYPTVRNVENFPMSNQDQAEFTEWLLKI